MANEGENQQQQVTEEKKKEEEKTIENEKTDNAEKKKEEKPAADQAAAPAQSQPAAPKLTVHKPDFEKDTVYLYQFSRTPQVPSISPYCLKVETWLRLNGIKYENVDHKMKYRSKKGLLPFVELNGEEIADSAIILRELGSKFNKDIDSGLTIEQKNVSHAMMSMIENHLYCVYMWWRIKYPDNILKGYKMNLQQVLGSKFPNSFLNLYFRFTYCRRGLKRVKAQGLGTHKPEEIQEFGQNDLKVLSEMLGDKPFFFGEEPTTLDIVTFANVAQICLVDKEVGYPLRDWLEENCSNLLGLVNRMKERCYPDWDEMCSTLELNTHLPKPVKEEKEEEKKEKEKDEKEKEGEKEKADKDEKEKEKENDKEPEKGENKSEENKDKKDKQDKENK